MSVLTDVRIRHTAVPRSSRLGRFLAEALARFADAPLASPVVGAIRPTPVQRYPHHAVPRTRVMVELTCDRASVPHVRDLLHHALDVAGIDQLGAKVRCEDDGSTTVRAVVAVVGHPAPALEPVLTDLFVDPGIQGISWRPTAGPEA
jgi:hypothetical protein